MSFWRHFRFGGTWAACWVGGWVLFACHESDASRVNQRVAGGLSSADCREVEARAARDNRNMPRRLDADTVALGIEAHGCHVTFEYEMAGVRVEQVRADAMDRMHAASASELCIDRGARTALELGGSFTSVYWGAEGRRLGRFTVEASDCRSSPSQTLVARAAGSSP